MDTHSSPEERKEERPFSAASQQREHLLSLHNSNIDYYYSREPIKIIEKDTDSSHGE